MKKLILKRRLKKLYIEIQGYEMYGCGHSMQLTIDSYYYNLCVKFNNTVDKLRLIDNNCPNFKYDLN